MHAAAITQEMRRSGIKDLGCWTQVHPDDDWILSVLLMRFVLSSETQLKQVQCFHDALKDGSGYKILSSPL